ncbi:hypothetical protein CASFOL_005507 [Castilleja foliolosa]|uniref:U3 small nucleolar RNA-associated protein 15 C-terminal domain-containing protein n=1 Tax=Castilleja foliolosa TaxID=1961234 RepID=A0ABD3E7M7_9LAMI
MAETFPVKPKLKPTSGKTTLTPESKYWRSFKTPKDIESKSLVYPINSISFNPIAPHDIAAAHSATVSIISGKTLDHKHTISDFRDTAASVSHRLDGKLLAASDLTGTVHVFTKTRDHLRRLKGHTAAARLVRYPRFTDKLHLFSGGDDSVVKYWDVSTEKCLINFLGHKDYVRCGDASPVQDELFISGSYDHKIKVWDVRGSQSVSVMELNHEKPVESAIYLPSGGLIATSGGNFVKIWDLIGGGKLLYSMESHNKTVTSLCLGQIKNNDNPHRILSVSLDGYLKVFDYAKFKITHTTRFPEPLLSVGFSPDCSTRVIGTSKGTLYIGRRKNKDESEDINDRVVWKGVIDNDEPRKEVLRPSYYRYFHRGQNVKPSQGDFLIKRAKKVKLAEHDKLLKKFRHKEAFVVCLNNKNPGNIVAVMEELVARKKLKKCVMNLDKDELVLLLGFLQKYAMMPRYAGFLTKMANWVLELRAEDIRGSDEMRNQIRNMKRDVEEEIRVQQALLEVQGVISPILKIAAKR